MESSKECSSEDLKDKQSAVYDYFTYEFNEKKEVINCICIVPTDENFKGGPVDPNNSNICKKTFKKDKCSVLKKHIERKHKKLYVEIQKKDNEIKKKDTPESTPSQAQKRQGEIIDYFPQKKAKRVNLIYDIKWLYKGIVELVCVNGEPFTVAQKSGFQTMFNPIATAFGISLYPEKIKEIVREEAKEHRQLLANIITERRLVPIKFDFARNQGKSFIGLTTQYFENGKIQVRTLACIEVTEQHTGEHIKQMITKILQQFGLSLDNIIANTIDNAANGVKAGSLMDDEQMKKQFEKMYNLAGLEHEDLDLSGETETEEEEYFFLQIVDKINKAFGIPVIRCGCHTFQLGILDVLPFKKAKKKKTDENQEEEEENEAELVSKDEDDYDKIFAQSSFQDYLLVIKKVRGAAIKLRTQNNMNVIRRKNYLVPILDCPTRWNSTFFMLERMEKWKEGGFLDDPEIKNVKEFTPEEWNLIQEMVKVLKPFKNASLKMQKPNSAYTDLYVIIKVLEIEVKKIDSPLAKELLKSVKKRLKPSLTSEIFKAAILLDPRINMDLKKEDQDIGIAFLVALARRLNMIESERESSSHEEHPSVIDPDVEKEKNPDVEKEKNPDDPESDDEDVAIAELEKLFKKKREEKEKEIGRNIDVTNLEEEIKNFLKEPMMLLKADILAYWEKKKGHKLYNLAVVILAIPFAQVSVERLFSILKFIHNMYRTRIGSDILADVMFLNTNFGRLYQ